MGRVYSALRSDYAPSHDDAADETPPPSTGYAEKSKSYMTQSLTKYNTGFTRTYIPSEHIGLYEKYGYRYLKDIVNFGNGTDRLYVKELGR